MIARLFHRRRLDQTFALSSALLVIFVLGAITLVVHHRLESVLARGLQARARSVAQSIGAVATPSLLAYNYPALQIAANGAAGDPDIRYVVIHDKEGRVAGIAGALADEQVLSDARDSDEGVPEQIVDIVSRRVDYRREDGVISVLEVGVPVHVEGAVDPWGTVRVGMAYGVVTAELRRIKLVLGLVGLALAGIAVVASRWTARRISAPLRRLAHATEALAIGDLSHRIPATGARELADLAHAFNVMMRRVQEKVGESEAYQQELAGLNATLEQQVEERTQALVESEKQYRSLVEHSPEAILIVQDAALQFVNPSFERTFGIPSHFALADGFRLASLFDRDSAARVLERISAWTRNEEAGSVEVCGIDVSGRQCKLELRGSRIDYRGRPAAACLLVDITDAQQLREQLEDANRLRSLGELSSGVAHDFNNLLGAILGRVQLLLRRELPDAAVEDLQTIEQAARDGRQTVLRIQEFARTRADRPFGAVDLSSLVEDAVEITRSRWKTDAERRGVTIDVRCVVERVPKVLGDETELREVMTNLILNAVEAMPEGGRLGVECRVVERRVCVKVKDEGVGMPESVRRRLFDPFFSTKGVTCNGMGLSVAYGIVKRHGGQIDVVSELGHGTCFTLEFPALSSDVSPDAGARASATARDESAPARILVIDDERPLAELVADTLLLDGHRVDTALCGAKGLELAAGCDYDVVLSDLGMPGMSGWDVADAFHRDHPAVPVILVTGWGTTITEDEVDSHGVAAVVQKPFELTALLETVTRVLDQARDGRSTPAPETVPADSDN